MRGWRGKKTLHSQCDDGVTRLLVRRWRRECAKSFAHTLELLLIAGLCCGFGCSRVCERLLLYTKALSGSDSRVDSGLHPLLECRHLCLSQGLLCCCCRCSCSCIGRLLWTRRRTRLLARGELRVFIRPIGWARSSRGINDTGGRVHRRVSSERVASMDLRREVINVRCRRGMKRRVRLSARTAPRWLKRTLWIVTIILLAAHVYGD